MLYQLAIIKPLGDLRGIMQRFARVILPSYARDARCSWQDKAVIIECFPYLSVARKRLEAPGESLMGMFSASNVSRILLTHLSQSTRSEVDKKESARRRSSSLKVDSLSVE